MSEFQADSGQDHSNQSEGNGESHIFHNNAGDLINYNLLGGDLQYYKLGHLTEGLRISNGIRFGILFMSFIGWLYIVYWIRHHEPLNHQAIGTNTISKPTTSQDKSIVDSIKNAFPLITSSNFGKLYVPAPANQTNTYQLPGKPESISKEMHQPINGQAGDAISAPLIYADPEFDQRFGYPTNSKL